MCLKAKHRGSIIIKKVTELASKLMQPRSRGGWLVGWEVRSEIKCIVYSSSVVQMPWDTRRLIITSHVLVVVEFSLSMRCLLPSKVQLNNITEDEMLPFELEILLNGAVLLK